MTPSKQGRCLESNSIPFPLAHNFKHCGKQVKVPRVWDIAKNTWKKFVKNFD
jgi:hypothetical protein